MANENALWKTVQRNMRGRWKAQRLEDKLSYGIPDVGFVMMEGGNFGFMELKRIPEYPKREATPIRVPHRMHWKIQQAWIHSFGKRTGKVFLLFQVEKDYYLFDWRAVSLVGELTKANMISYSLHCWSHSINYNEFCEFIRKEHR